MDPSSASPIYSDFQAGPHRLPAARYAEIDDFVVLPAPPETPLRDKLRLEGIYRIYSRTLRGGFAREGDDFFFLQSHGGRPIGHAMYSSSRRNPDYGILSFVLTAPEWRGRGLATELNRRLLEHFRARGGRAMHLGHSGPVARGVYLRCGFKDYHGQTMRWLADEAGATDFDRTYFAPGGPLGLRPAEWGDGAMATIVFMSRIPWAVRDFTDGTIWRSHEQWTRSTSIFYALTGRSEKPGNSMHVIEAGNRVVGIVSLVGGSAPDGTQLEFMLHPNFSDTALPLLRRHLADRPDLRSHAGAGDEAKRALLDGLGFAPAGAAAPGIDLFRRP